MLFYLDISTQKRCELIDITSRINQIVSKSGVKEGVCFIYVPHTTAAITINENADPAVSQDILMEINKIVPFSDRYQHTEGNSAAHIKSSIIGFNEMLIISEGRLVLGTWQGIYFCEFDGPRRRKTIIKIIEG